MTADRDELQNPGQDGKPSEVSSRRDALVERMAVLFRPIYATEAYRRIAASAVLDLALEEAAKVAEAHRGTWEEEEAAAKIIATAIRALKGKP